MRPTIALFDVDGTLVCCGGAGRRAMQRAFAEHGAPPEASAFDFGGMTDVAIARTALRRAGLADDATTIARLLDRYIALLREEVPRAAGYRVLPGAHDLLDRLTAIPRVAVGLGTGNLEAGAAIKLAPGRLRDRFAFGGFGSDHEERARLLTVGAGRGAALLGRAREDCRVVVIGDTPRDVEAARAIGAASLGVATGRHDAAALREAGATCVVERLDDPRAFAMITGAA